MPQPHLSDEEVKAKWIIASAAVLFLAIFFSGLYVSYLSFHVSSATQIEQLQIMGVTFGSTPGQVIFALHNLGSQDITIIEATKSGGSSNSSSVPTNTLISAGFSLSLTVDFPNVTFQPGVNYNFVLVTSHGNSFPYAITR